MFLFFLFLLIIILLFFYLTHIPFVPPICLLLQLCLFAPSMCFVFSSTSFCFFLISTLLSSFPFILIIEKMIKYFWFFWIHHPLLLLLVVVVGESVGSVRLRQSICYYY